MTEKQWEKIQGDTQWAGVFVLIGASEPPEVTALKAKQDNGVDASQPENEA